MSISSIFTQAAGAVSAASVDPVMPPATAWQGSGDSTSLSQMSQLMSQLNQLSITDPTEFKQVTASIATQLQQAAKEQGGSSGGFLSSLASKFQTASQSGSMAIFEPHGHGHHHGGGGTDVLQSLAGTTSTGWTPASQVGAAYSSSSPQSTLNQVLGIISQSLSAAGASSATS